MTAPQPKLRFKNAISAHSALSSIDIEQTPLSVPINKRRLIKSFTTASFVAGCFATVSALQYQFSSLTASDSSRSIPASSLFADCDRLSGTGKYYGDIGGGSINTANISCADALDNCRLNASSNPHLDIRCTWNNTLIFSRQN